MKIHLDEFEIDNRDINTTELHLTKDGTRITLEVTREQLIGLLVNMDENNPEEVRDMYTSGEYEV